MFCLFWVTITLTDKGLANWMYVANSVFQYLNMLRIAGPQKWIFEEIKAAAELKYGWYILYYILCA